MFPDLCRPPLHIHPLSTLIYCCRIFFMLFVPHCPFVPPFALQLSVFIIFIHHSSVSQILFSPRPATWQHIGCSSFTVLSAIVFFFTLVCAMLSAPLGPLRARIWNILERHIFAVLEHKRIRHGRGCLKWLHRGNQNQNNGFEKQSRNVNAM